MSNSIQVSGRSVTLIGAMGISLFEIDDGTLSILIQVLHPAILGLDLYWFNDWGN